MKLQNKKLLALAVSVGIAAGVAGTVNAVTADAAVKENLVADSVLTTAGIINEVDWALKGETAATSFGKDVKGDVLTAQDIAWAAGWLAPWDTSSFANGNVTMEMDILGFGGGAWRPYIAAGGVDWIKDSLWLNGELIDSGAHSNPSGLVYWADEAMTTPYAAAAGTNAWYYPVGYPFCATSYHVQFIFTQSGMLGIVSSPINEDGSLGVANPVWIQNAFAGLDGTTDYYFGLNYWGNMTIDNFKLSNPSATIFETTFSGSGWNTNDGVPVAGAIHNPNAKVKTIAEVTATPANTDRMVTEMKVTADENLNEVFKLSGTMDIRSLGKKFGFAIGLDEQEGAINETGTSYVYFSQVEGVTYVTVVNDGVEGTPISLEGDYVAGEFYDFELFGKKDASTLTINGKTVELAIANLEGYFAMVTDGEGDASVAFGADTNLVKYVYRASAGGAVANNFNTGYVNPENWESNSINAVMVQNAADAKGIIYEDGVVKFEGTADGSYFGTSEAYADYVLEFLYSEKFAGDKPALQESWVQYGHSPLAINLAVTQPGGGWAKSIMIFLKPGNVQMQDFTQAGRAPEDGVIDYTFAGQAAGEVKTTAIKMVVANNTITVYYQPVVEGTAPTAEAYVQAAQFTVADTYGRIAFATTDSGYFMLDDVRVTPIDSPKAEEVTANAAAYVSFAPIADEYRPYTLEAPEIDIDGTTIIWEAVEGATGYVVNVNGNETTVGADVLSYDVDVSAYGDYVITVKAIGNGAHISDSEQSEAIEFTVQEPTTSEPTTSEPTTSEPTTSKPEEEKKGGCGSMISVMAPALFAVAGVAMLLKKKED
jgi:hypothetical protein